MDHVNSVNRLLDGVAKPPASLGLFEDYFKKILLAWETIYDQVRPHHLVFAADNGIVAEGVSAFPPAITYLQAKNMVAGSAAVSCFCKSAAIPYWVIDVGIDHAEAVGMDCKTARGTKSFMQAEAMTEQQLDKVWQTGRRMVQQLSSGRQPVNLLSFGEMGIGNTTTSAAVLHALTGADPALITGYGASYENYSVLAKKHLVVRAGVEKHQAAMHSVKDILRCVGGFDLVAICAGMLECMHLKIPFVIDGFITAVAYACAVHLERSVERYAIPSHLSKEPGMAHALEQGNIAASDVIIHGKMALGEGTGAVLMVSMLKNVAFTYFHMAKLSCLLEGQDKMIAGSVG